MAVHDWTRVEAGIFHDFHTVWIGGIRNALNEGLLPEGYYALAEQHAGQFITDVLTLHASVPPADRLPALPPATGGVLVADAPPPRMQRKQVVEPTGLAPRRRSLAIRHVSGHRLIALVEIVSPANKDRAASVEEFATKAVSALDCGVHLLLVDLLPPGLHDPNGMHNAIVQRLSSDAEEYKLPDTAPLTLAGYAAGPRIEIYLEHLAVGDPLSDEVPLFLRPDRYVPVPLEKTYQAAYHGMPAFWRDVLERPLPPVD